MQLRTNPSYSLQEEGEGEGDGTAVWRQRNGFIIVADFGPICFPFLSHTLSHWLALESRKPQAASTSSSSITPIHTRSESPVRTTAHAIVGIEAIVYSPNVPKKTKKKKNRCARYINRPGYW